MRTEPITEVSQIKTPQLATIGEVYARSEEDLTSASVLLEGFGKNDVWLSYYACQAYLMRLHLQKRNYVAAETFAHSIINSSEFQLADTPTKAFNNMNNSAEDIFAVQQTAANSAGDRSTGSGLPNYYSSLPQSGLGVMRIFEFPLTSPFQAHGPKYSSQDLRGINDTNVDSNTTIDQITTPFYTNVLNTSLLSSSKFIASDRVIPKIRLAEIYLSRAEILYEQDMFSVNPMALSDLNMVRNRSGLPSLVETDFYNSFAFYDILILEKKRELIYEGVLFHDLKRWKSKIGQTVATAPKFILPIPQSETDTWTN